jgi:CRISPR-associated protein Cas2
LSLLIITEAKLEKLKKEIKKICHEDEDSVMIYKFDSLKYSTKEVIGLIMANDNIL